MSALQINSKIKDTIKHWKYISNDIHDPLNNADYNRLSSILDRLLDIVGENENHELIGLVDVISHMISMYDERHDYKINGNSSIKAIKFLMEQHNLKQTDLPEIGSQGVVSEVLKGKRKLNLNQVKRLSNKFNVSAETFID